MSNKEKINNILSEQLSADNFKQTSKEYDFGETIKEAQEWINETKQGIEEHAATVDKHYKEITEKSYAYFEKALTDKNSDQNEKFLKAIDKQVEFLSKHGIDTVLKEFPFPEQELFPDKAPELLNKSGIQKALELIAKIQPELNKRIGNFDQNEKAALNNLIFSAILNKGLPVNRLTKINGLTFPECFKDNKGDNYCPLVNFSKSLSIEKLKGDSVGYRMPGVMCVNELEGNYAGQHMSGTMRIEKLDGNNAGRKMPGTMRVEKLEGYSTGLDMSGAMQVGKLEGVHTGQLMSGAMLFNEKKGSFGDGFNAGASIYWHDQDKYYVVYEEGSDYTQNEEYKIKKEEVKAISNKDDKDIVSIGLRTDPQTNKPNKQGLWILDNINGLDHNIPLFEKGILVLRKIPKSPCPLIKEMTNGIIIIEDKDFKGGLNDIVSDFKGGIIEIKDPEADKGKRVILGKMGEVGD